MSSNTLRGVGQDGDGSDGKGERAGQKTSGSDAGAQSDGGTPADLATIADGAERMPELRNVRSLDSTVPGTRSLDSSVPDAQPSLDGRVPSMAATMLGMTAPSIPKREAAARTGGSREPAGTVQGRDVHLPVELQRRAGVIAVPGSALPTHHDAAPEAVDRSEPTIADPVRLPHGSRDMNSHGPWYEQDPAGADAYDDPKPNLIGRVAIGAAIAASLSVVLFAVVRVRAQNAAQEAEALQVQPPVFQQAPSPPVPDPPAAVAPSPPPYPAGLPPEPGAAPSAPPATADSAAETAGRPARTGDQAAPPPARTVVAPAQTRQRPPTPRPSASATSGFGSGPNKTEPLPANLFRPKALGDSEPAVPTAPPPIEASSATATAPPPPASTPFAPAESGPSQPGSVRPGAAGEVPGTGTRARGKKPDDPDSTLPLNID